MFFFFASQKVKIENIIFLNVNGSLKVFSPSVELKAFFILNKLELVFFHKWSRP